MTFTPEQIKSLEAGLDRRFVKERKQAGRKLSYIEGWQVISEANRIFGFGAWSSETIDIRAVSEAPRKIGEQKRDGFGVSYVARVRITVNAGGATIIREGVGSGHGIDVDIGLAHESALKEAETDARKRALMTFGNPFGLALYDKSQSNVVDASDNPPAPLSAEIADAMIDALAKRAGEDAVNRLLDHPQVKTDLGKLDRPDFDRVMAVANERRREPAARAA